MIPGHENVGVVVSVGSEVKNFQVGDRVGCSLFRRSCGKFPTRIYLKLLTGIQETVVNANVGVAQISAPKLN